MKNYILPKKSELKQLKISDIVTEMPDMKNSELTKTETIAKWLEKQIMQALNSKVIEVNNILPSKAEFAYLLGVSIGTIQNVLRTLENKGITESKQCIGTLVKNPNVQSETSFRKLISKRELAIEAIKRYIATGGFKIGAKLPSTATISTITDFTVNTTRAALESLCCEGVIAKEKSKINDNNYIVKKMDFETSSENLKSAKTLVSMVVKDIEDYITKNLKVGDKMPTHAQLAQKVSASIKTVHDALNVLAERGVILARRGTYGTYVVRIPHRQNSSSNKPESAMFAPAKDAMFYHYEKIQNALKKRIASEYEIGDKLPSIKELSAEMDVSPNTIRKAFHNLAKDGYLVFSRGRYGGTFVIDIPEVETQSFKWLAVSHEYAVEGDKTSRKP